MAYAYATQEAAQPAPILTLHVEAELGCLMCGRTVGEVIKGRIVQHRGCPNRLQIDRGLLRCCHCNGPVYREPINAIVPR
jgi:hypothetical protein